MWFVTSQKDGAATGKRTVVCAGFAADNEGIMFALLPARTTLGNGADPSNSTVAPGSTNNYLYFDGTNYYGQATLDLNLK